MMTFDDLQAALGGRLGRKACWSRRRFCTAGLMKAFSPCNIEPGAGTPGLFY